jgi:PKD repeat protein
MGLKPLLACLVLASLAFAGCAGKDKDDDGTATSSSSTSRGATAATNHAPTAALNVSAVNGSAPLNVTFTVSGADADNDTLSWTLAFGDNTTANGTSLPANVTHLFTAAGAFLANLTVTDGVANATANVTVSVAGASGGIPGPLRFEGTLTALPYVPQVGSPNGQVESATVVHDFAFTGAPGKMTLTLAYEEGLFFTDIDIFVTDPSGTETASEEAGPEPPLEIAAPAAGAWSVRVFAYGGEGDVDYTLDITFE